MAIHMRFTEMFGCRHPLQQAGMGGIATPDLAIAMARSGGLGMLSAGPHLPELLDAVPFGAAVGVNLLATGTEDVPHWRRRRLGRRSLSASGANQTARLSRLFMPVVPGRGGRSARPMRLDRQKTRAA